MTELTSAHLTEAEEDQIKHYGILGMKWGRRKTANGYKPSGKKARGERSDDRKEVDSLRENHVSTLTNAELKKINERLNLERNYSTLTTTPSAASQTLERGRQIGKGVLGSLQAANTLYNLYNSKMVRQGRQLLGEQRDKQVTAGYANIRQQLLNARK